MAEWRAGIKLLLAAYNGPEIVLTSKKGSFSDLIKETNADEIFEFLFQRSDFFDKQAFNEPDEGSTKGTMLHHHFNNFALSPSRASEELAKELSEVVSSDGFKLPIQSEYIRIKWYVESYGEILKKLTKKEYQLIRKNFIKKNTCYLDIFSLKESNEERLANKQFTKYQNGSTSNIVLYGPPGTGKTRGAILLADKMMKGEKFPTSSVDIQEQSTVINSDVTKSNNWYSVQFHPSFSYEDFFEGLRPVQTQNDGKSDLSYDVIPGVFKVVSQLARASLEAGVYGIEVKATFLDGSIELWLKSSGGIAELYRFQARNGYFEINGDKIYQTGVDGKEIKRFTITDKFNGNALVKWFSSNAEPEQFILFIDELNRGNPAKIFGEALSLVELSKRYGAEEPSFLNLPYSHERFSVPINLSLICAMNSSDKSLAHIDQAFRRRFKFMYLGPSFDFIAKDEFINKVLEGKIKPELVKGLVTYFKVLNDSLLAVDISIDNHIGHSFVIDILKKLLNVVKVNEKWSQEKLIYESLVRFWNFELHGLLREILNQHTIEDFVEQHYSRLLNHKDDFKFIITDEKFKDELKKYLQSAGAEDASTFLKAA